MSTSRPIRITVGARRPAPSSARSGPSLEYGQLATFGEWLDAWISAATVMTSSHVVKFFEHLRYGTKAQRVRPPIGHDALLRVELLPGLAL